MSASLRHRCHFASSSGDSRKNHVHVLGNHVWKVAPCLYRGINTASPPSQRYDGCKRMVKTRVGGRSGGSGGIRIMTPLPPKNDFLFSEQSRDIACCSRGAGSRATSPYTPSSKIRIESEKKPTQTLWQWYDFRIQNPGCSMQKAKSTEVVTFLLGTVESNMKNIF
jgi:hypothetical protein